MSTVSLFEKHNDEYIKFDRVESKVSTRPDIHAFIMLDALFPANRDMVCAAGHDIIYLDVESEDIEKLNEEQVIELLRCGVLYDSETDSLTMFV